MFLGLSDPHLDLLVTSTDPDPKPSSVLMEGGGRGSGWGKSQIIRPRESMALHKLLNTLWPLPFSMPGVRYVLEKFDAFI
jgi:hypothetical protein